MRCVLQVLSFAFDVSVFGWHAHTGLSPSSGETLEPLLVLQAVDPNLRG